jgi:flagellin-like hook-associated protein FlgL
LDAAASAATARQSSLNTSLNSVAGIDLTQTITQLTQAQNAYQLAMQSSASILQLRSSLLSSLP